MCKEYLWAKLSHMAFIRVCVTEDLLVHPCVCVRLCSSTIMDGKRVRGQGYNGDDSIEVWLVGKPTQW